MFFTISKRVGPFTIVVGKRISLASKKSYNKSNKNSDFSFFLSKVESDINNCLYAFIKAKGFDVKTLEKEKTDLDIIFAGDKTYSTLKSMINDAKIMVQQAIYSDDFGTISKRKITDKVFDLKALLFDDLGITNQEINASGAKIKQGNFKILSFLFWVGVFFMPYIFSWFTLRRKYSIMQKIIAFAWMIVVIAMLNTK